MSGSRSEHGSAGAQGCRPFTRAGVVPADCPLAESDLLYDRWILLRKGKRNYDLLAVAS
jgi:hypothetical protein